MKKIFYSIISLLFTKSVLADSGSHSITFPVWTYYVEIVEHSLIILVSLIAVILLFKKINSKNRNSVYLMSSGLVALIIAQFITNLHHFLIYPFGIWNAVIHHGLYFISIVLMIMAFFKTIKKT